MKNKELLIEGFNDLLDLIHIEMRFKECCLIIGALFSEETLDTELCITFSELILDKMKICNVINSKVLAEEPFGRLATLIGIIMASRDTDIQIRECLNGNLLELFCEKLPKTEETMSIVKLFFRESIDKIKTLHNGLQERINPIDGTMDIVINDILITTYRNGFARVENIK